MALIRPAQSSKGVSVTAVAARDRKRAQAFAKKQGVAKVHDDYPSLLADPDIDALLYLLRNLDMVLAMRFHACIFAMSQGRPTIGIDYDIGAGGKVLQLFRDRELVEDVRRLDEADIYFMVERLLKNQPGGNNHPDKYP